MKIVNGTLDQDGGERITKNNLEIQMLDQRPNFKEGHTVREAVEDGLRELNEAKEKYNELSLKLAYEFDNKNTSKEIKNQLEQYGLFAEDFTQSQSKSLKKIWYNVNSDVISRLKDKIQK